MQMKAGLQNKTLQLMQNKLVQTISLVKRKKEEEKTCIIC